MSGDINHATGMHGMMVPPPAGIMNAHTLGRGQVMPMYSRMWMQMEGLKNGTSDTDPETVVTTVPNRFFGAPMQPPPLRMVPLSMSSSMQMFGASYGLTDSITLFASGTYVEKEMYALTFQGMMGTTRLGTNTVKTEGLGDTSIGGLVRIYQGQGTNISALLGVSLPTGSIDEEVTPLMPNGMRMVTRANYGLQLGTGTYDGLVGLNYLGSQGPLSWGVVYRGRIGLENENDEGYSWGDRHMVTGWLSYAVTEGLFGTARLAGSHWGAVDGMDPQIMGAARGANPDYYGGERIEAFLGMNAHTHIPGLGMNLVGIEAGTPLYENLNGVQLSKEWSLQATAGIHF